MLLVNLGIIVTISFILSLLGFTGYGGGADLQSLAVFCFAWGLIGSFISLMLSKTMAKFALGVQVIPANSSNGLAQKVYEMVRRASERAGLPKIPEVGVYESAELNAFATGPSRSNALVAVSTGLVESMDDQELEGVIGHEVAHIANGDMVTMALLQGVVNALVMFVARIVASVVSNSVEERSRPWLRFLLVSVFEIAFGILGLVVTSWFSRRREFRADAGSATYMGREKMIAALKALQSKNRQIVDSRAPELQTFKIYNKSRGGFVSLMMSHPPLEDRIAALQRAG